MALLGSYSWYNRGLCPVHTNHYGLAVTVSANDEREGLEANTKAIDSFLNFETVKYFNNEEHEYRRYDEALAGYEKAAVTSQTSLSLLNLGQGAIVAVGLILVMWMAAAGVISGDNTIGDFVMVNTFLIQLYLR